jgi:hypothetical protein
MAAVMISFSIRNSLLGEENFLSPNNFLQIMRDCQIKNEPLKKKESPPPAQKDDPAEESKRRQKKD